MKEQISITTGCVFLISSNNTQTCQDGKSFTSNIIFGVPQNYVISTNINEKVISYNFIILLRNGFLAEKAALYMSIAALWPVCLIVK
jgi:hypothetical protein